MKDTSKRDRISPFLVYIFIFLITQVILAFFIGKAYFSPSQFVYATHGDGGIIYFNVIYHALFGNGFLLENMNYPRFESIFMTDAQATLSIIFSWFKGRLNPEKVVAWLHIFHYLMFGLATVYIYKIFEVIKIRTWLAIISAILIVFLSPVTFRLQAGHYGLFYPFVFAYTTYYVVRIYMVSRTTFFDVLKMIAVLVFFGLNNIYLIAINSAFLIAVTFPILFNRQLRGKWWRLLAPALSGLIIVFLFIYFSDIGSDRIQIQWGYQENRTTIPGILFPPTSLLYKLLSTFVTVLYSSGESWLNIGLAPLIILLAVPFILKKKIIDKNILQLWMAFLFAAAIMLLYSSAILYESKLLRDYIFHRFEFASMFKAAGRFSIPIYFMLTTVAVYFLNQIVSLKSGKIITAIILLLWCIETNMFLNHHAFGKFFKNPFTEQSFQSIRNNLNNSKVYQGIYTLPVMEAWNDKFHMDSDLASASESRMISMATGLPMINATLSRIGLTDGERAIQMASHPLVRKSMPAYLPFDKPILLVVSKQFAKYSEGEKYLIANSELVYENAECEWRRLQIDKINNETLIQNALSEIRNANGQLFTKDSSFFAIEHFDTLKSNIHFSAPGALAVSEEQIIFEVELADSISGGHEISLYCHVRPELFGNPSFVVKSFGKDGSEIVMHRSISKDNFIDWVRVWGWMDIPPESQKLTISVIAVNQTYYIDDICIKNWESTLIDGHHGFYNNFRIIE